MNLLTRLALIGLLALIVYAVGDHAPGAFEDPAILAALAVGAACFGAIFLRSSPDRRYRRQDMWRRRRTSVFDLAGRAILTIGVWAVLVTSLAVIYDHRDSLRSAALSTLSALKPGESVDYADRTTVLLRESGGHFVASAQVNGRNVRMLVDTGSSDVAIPFDEAIRLGVDTNALIFDSPVMTANGQAMVAPVTLTTVSVGGIILNDVRASVAEPGKLGSALLGMSFLGALSEVSLSGDRLELKQ